MAELLEKPNSLEERSLVAPDEHVAVMGTNPQTFS